MENPQQSVEIRTSSEEETPRTWSLGQVDRRADTEGPTSIYTMIPAGDPGGSRELHWGRSRLPHNLHAIRPARSERAPIALAGADDRKRLERDLHDGVQNELVAVIVRLAHAQADPDTPPALARTLAALEARAQAALDSVRKIARGIYPALLADLGLAQALRATAARAPADVSLVGTAPRSTEAGEEAVYFSCSEAMQNAAKYAGRAAHITLRLDHHHETLRVRIADDGPGFDPARTPEGAGLQNIRDRIEGLGGRFKVASQPGVGTVLTISLPWPTAADRR